VITTCLVSTGLDLISLGLFMFGTIIVLSQETFLDAVPRTASG